MVLHSQLTPSGSKARAWGASARWEDRSGISGCGQADLVAGDGFPSSAFLDGKERSREMGKSRLGLAPARERRSRCRTCGHSGGQVKIQDMAV